MSGLEAGPKVDVVDEYLAEPGVGRAIRRPLFGSRTSVSSKSAAVTNRSSVAAAI